MRYLISLPAAQAELLADHLLTLGVPTSLQDQPDAVEVWVRDEDHVERAKEELALFQKQPTDPRYQAARPQARAIRAREQKADSDYERRTTALRERMTDVTRPERMKPVTLTLLVACVLVAALTQLGSDRESTLYQTLLIAPVIVQNNTIYWDDLKAITEKAELWRLVTPMFLHFGLMHILFNLLMFARMGSDVERRLGPGLYLGVILLISAVSNLAEYYVQISFTIPGLIAFTRSPLFGGMSGVLYGLFGYLWMLARASDDSERVMPKQTVFILLFWLVICMSGAMGPIANTAHLVGLLVGVGVGQLAVTFRR